MTELHSSYYDQEAMAARVARGEHRAAIGGLWDELGALQLEFLKSNGLLPHHRLLDIGCGSLRLGVRAAAYLDAGCYWGADLNRSLLDAGYEKEIVAAGLAEKLPRTNLVVDQDFTFPSIPREIDFAMAQSVFTHLPFNHLRLCLANLAEHVSGPCAFFATVFIAPDRALSRPLLQEPGGITTYPHRDPYHYALADLWHAAGGLPWKVQYVGGWNHPRNQKMVVFRKLK